MQNPGQACLVRNIQEQFSPGWLAYLLKVPRGRGRDNTHLRPRSRGTAMAVLLRGQQRGFTSNFLPHKPVCGGGAHAHTHIRAENDGQRLLYVEIHSPLSLCPSPVLFLSASHPPSLCSISGIDEINSSDFHQVWYCEGELKSFQYVDFRLKPITVLRGAWPPPPAGERRLGCAWWDRDGCNRGYSLVLWMFTDFSTLQPRGIKTIALMQMV